MTSAKSENRARQPQFLQEVLVSALLLGVTLAAFANVREAGFILNGDDNDYVVDNPYVHEGLTAEGFWWAFTIGPAYNWHPLTWWSLELDSTLFGIKPLGYHLTNLLLHAGTAVLLFWALRLMTTSIWRSAWVATIFALHPLRVESVAWISERKDVLSAFFWMLTLLGYIGYARRPTVGRYHLVLVLFALGLMSKPMLVTLPFVLLLLDYWPLARYAPGSRLWLESPSTPSFAPASLGRLILEKLPLLVMSTGCSVATVAAQREIVQQIQHFSLESRLENALVAAVSYLGRMAWPRDLAFFYPHRGDEISLWQAVGSGAVLAAVTVWVIWNWRRPYLLVGWFWYLGTLVPVIGLVQVGQQAMADRYTYVPMIGILISICWGAAELIRRWQIPPLVWVPATGVLGLVLAIMTHVQVSFWRNHVTLWQHTLEACPENYLAHYQLGYASFQAGKLDDAIAHYRETLRLRPDHVAVHSELGIALARRGQLAEAIDQFQEAVRLEPNLAKAHNHLGMAYAGNKEWERADQCFREALRLDPDYELARKNLALLKAARRKQRQ